MFYEKLQNLYEQKSSSLRRRTSVGTFNSPNVAGTVLKTTLFHGG